MNEQHLIALVSVMFTIIIGIVGYSYNRIISRLDRIDHRYHECLRQFADKESNASAHKDLYSRTDALDRRVTVIETRVGG